MVGGRETGTWLVRREGWRDEREGEKETGKDWEGGRYRI